jgi:hypothetical protein
MAKRLLIDPDTIRVDLQRRYAASHGRWLQGEGHWPLSLPLGLPNESEALARRSETLAWLDRWRAWRGEGNLSWVTRHWSSLGTQVLPERLVLAEAVQVVRWIDEDDRWHNAYRHHDWLTSRWKAFHGHLGKHFRFLAESSDKEVHRLISVLEWLEKNPASGLYPRQVPVAGIDTKWLSSREGLLIELLPRIRGRGPEECDFHEITGLRREPVRLRVRILGEAARKCVGGLGDIEAPLDEIAALVLPLDRVFIVENLRTGLSFENGPTAAVFMRQGYAVDLFDRIPWLKTHPCLYWGDLDTHGFSILNRLRHHLPHAQSILMDERTLLRHRELWGTEETPVQEVTLPMLTPPEHEMFSALRSNRWSRQVRLEQERIPWDYARTQLSARD